MVTARLSAEIKGLSPGEVVKNRSVSPVESTANFQRSTKAFIICSYEGFSESETGAPQGGDAVLNEGSIAYGNKMSSKKGRKDDRLC